MVIVADKGVTSRRNEFQRKSKTLRNSIDSINANWYDEITANDKRIPRKGGKRKKSRKRSVIVLTEKKQSGKIESRLKVRTAQQRKNILAKSQRRLRKMGVTKQSMNISVAGLIDKAENEEVLFNMAIQRNYVWKPEQASSLIHSVLEGFPIPAMFGWDNGDNIQMMDGKQRSTTFVAYGQDKFALVGKEITPVVYMDKKESDQPITFDPKGKRFSELPKKLQDKVRQYSLLLYTFKKDAGETRSVEELQEKIFLRLNSGAALTKMEIIRSQAGQSIMEYINKISNMPFFQESMYLSFRDKLRFVDNESAFQTLILLENGGQACGIGTDAIDAYRVKIRLQGISPELQERMETLTAYMGEAFPVREKWLKKVHVPILFMMANKALSMNTPIPAAKFGGWAQHFFKLYNENMHAIQKQYEAGCLGGTAKQEKVERRIKYMTTDFDRNVFDAADYTMPQVKVAAAPTVTTGKRRGRKSNAQKAAEAAALAQQDQQQQVAATTDTDLVNAGDTQDSAENQDAQGNQPNPPNVVEQIFGADPSLEPQVEK